MPAPARPGQSQQGHTGRGAGGGGGAGNDRGVRMRGVDNGRNLVVPQVVSQAGGSTEAADPNITCRQHGSATRPARDDVTRTPAPARSAAKALASEVPPRISTDEDDTR